MSELLEKEQNQETFGWAARDPSGILSPFHFHRRTNGDFDVTIKILYCGICHSDLHVVRNEFGISLYPVVPGHEIVGVVTQVGDKVQKFKLGDKAGVGCFVDSCGKCKHCKENLENYCPKAITTYTTAMFNGDTNKNYGGFSDIYVVNEHFVVQIPDTLPLEGAVPLLCAGITVFSPMKYFGLDKPGMHVGVVGLGGLGHVAVKFAKAFGMKVTVISTSERKREEAIQHLKADHFILSHDSEQMQCGGVGWHSGHSFCSTSIDAISGPVEHRWEANTVECIKFGQTSGSECCASACCKNDAGRKGIGGSSGGGMKETQEMIDFAAEKEIIADVEVVSMDYVNQAMERLKMGDVHYRFVIDIGNTLHAH
ncbi:probable mannitol dehydrogenase isoform X1 [Tripterygium wilfordii]|uniref:probable mannitol dehydrogenase isoform X1 n=1 Tax=Tripterygium wilfordii TaxID=458696 RepID=UPI0018F82C95|nr:probable mannitol dehydrogenase isoform X1 [Tripterygium wilfordii]